jgi:hypothetical protein
MSLIVVLLKLLRLAVVAGSIVCLISALIVISVAQFTAESPIVAAVAL